MRREERTGGRSHHAGLDSLSTETTSRLLLPLLLLLPRPTSDDRMRLLTHNMLVCNVKACADTAGREPGMRPLNFPLRVRCAAVRTTCQGGDGG